MAEAMKGTQFTVQSVRQVLATRTRQAHEALHEHPWIASLLDPELTISGYCTVLGAYHGFYQHVQEACSVHSIKSGLSLALARDRLKYDLDCLHQYHQNKPQIPVELIVEEPAELLGALYVLHGSSFGASILNKNVRRVLPDAPRHFLGSGTTRESWQQLINELEQFRGDDLAREKLINSASATFHAFGSHVTRYCESRRSSLVQTR
ncbi:biliverdin-producing heme oxygenase [Granulosicoccus antarcticus]|uniref:Heme oxygenase n=1 Tax=Granulosicoccus antarcticus IMCC3135 TaxID=1192854 RepID=A0A2Z2P755_9GAMM|nr:biliverdin-producing heme oxygenase [Granulosicoccus antarcticus]ASJ75684.1 hypothetical protein IMCC3135_28160 [Granulosicoccus antarcticus IMCC3135]